MTRLLIPWLALTTAASVALAQDAGAPPAEPAPAAQATPAAPAPAARVTYALQPASSDLYVVLRIALPPARDEAAKAAYRQFAQALHFNPRAQLGV